MSGRLTGKPPSLDLVEWTARNVLTEPVLRVAKALYPEAWWDDSAEMLELRGFAAVKAMDAIEALREPTEAMFEAAGHYMFAFVPDDQHPGGKEAGEREYADGLFRAMLNAALAGHGGAGQPDSQRQADERSEEHP